MAATPSSVPHALTGDNLVDAATHGYYWQLDGSRTITWAVANGFFGEFWNSPSAGVATLTTVFANLSSYANVNFQYVGYFTNPAAAYSGGSNITTSLDGVNLLFNSSSIWGRAIFPDSFNNTLYYQGAPGDVFLNINS